MASTDFDVQIGSTKAKVLRIEDGGYRKRTIRREVEQQLLSQSETPAMVSRGDQRQLYQNSWAGGSRWWKPLLTVEEADSYFQSNHMDVWSEPGKIIPDNKVTDTADTNLNTNARLVAWKGDIYTIGDTTTVGSGNDVYKWTPASAAFVKVAGVHTVTTNAPFAIAGGSGDNIHYLHNSGTAIFDPVGGSQATRITGLSVTQGAAIFLHQDNIVIYDGDVLYRDNAGSAVQIANDGKGRDYMENLGGGTIANQAGINLAISTPHGIYYVKNTLRNGQPMPFIFRVDKDEAGNWIVNPIATLPPGHLALDITEHLGSVLVSATPDPAGFLANDSSNYVEVVLFHYTQGSLGALGSMLGNRSELDESPYKFLQAKGSLLYIGGQKRLWIYDAARGGLHTAFEWGTAGSTSPYVSMAQTTNSSDEHINLWITTDRVATQKISQFDDPDTVTNFGDDESHYTLESNWFDGGLPMETKELTKVAILRQEDDGGSEWTVQVLADDGSFSDVLEDAGTAQYAEAAVTGTTGRKFRYKLIYQTKDTARKALEALLVTFTTGEMITEWDLTLDGDELLNVDNEVQDEQAFYDAMVTLADTATITTLVDNMQEQAQETDTGTTTNVKVQAVEINKQAPGESVVRVVLREA